MHFFVKLSFVLLFVNFRFITTYGGSKSNYSSPELFGPMKCPLGGDTKNDCECCVYSAEYHYNKKTGECEQR